MKSVFVYIFLLLFTIGFVFAVETGEGVDSLDRGQTTNVISDNANEINTTKINATERNTTKTDYDNKTIPEYNRSNNQRVNQTNQGIGQELSQQIRETKESLREGNYNGSFGTALNVRELSGNLRELRTNNISALTDLNITVENSSEGRVMFKTRLKNGSENEIKIMPDVAAERALERLRLRVCSSENNCTLELKSVGQGNEERVSYSVQVERHSRILAIFSKKMDVNAEVDATTGEVINVKKPWWAFIASEPSEKTS